MDGYVYVLDALSDDNFHRLNGYVPEPHSKFSSWLAVVVRRLVLDHLRQRYGRSRSDNPLRQQAQTVRRHLEDLVAAQIDPDDLIAEKTGPELALRRRNLALALRRCIERLEPSDRLLLALRFEDDMSVHEIASTLGMPTIFHVYRRLSRVLATLREGLGNCGVEDAEP